jgi:glycosyltransferase involved in cell wall biosynthesis
MLYCLAYRLARRWVNDYVAVSTETKQALVDQLGIAAQDVTVIHNGVDVDRYQQADACNAVRQELGLSPAAKLLITVGTLRTAKGHRYLIDAARQVVEQCPDVHFLLVGDGELRESLQAQVSACDLSHRIHFLGNRRDVSDLLAASDIFVLPSLWEGLSMALLEAMAAAKPVIATAVSGTSQVLTHNETGVLVAPGNAAELAKAIIDLLSRLDNTARAMGEAAQRFVKARYSVEKQASEYLDHYRSLFPSKAAQSQVSGTQ